MKYPEFFDKVDKIQLHDELSQFLGTFEDGRVEFSYTDVVKLSGHSCPTVAGAYLLAREGLKALYVDSLPQRGEIEVLCRDSYKSGTTGVVANVLSYITGATSSYGFKGIAGKYVRHSLLSFDQNINSDICMKTKDKTVCISYDPSSIPPHSQMKIYMQKQIQGTATKEEKKIFQNLWQKRVEDILFDYQKVITIE
jgi:hypothetical protein